MKIDITDAAFYGNWNSEESEKYKTIYWFEKSSCQFFYTGKLIKQFGYKSQKEIQNSGWFIPVFKRDSIAMQKEFISTYPDHKISEELKKIQNRNILHPLSLSVAFRILTQDYPEYDDFSNKYFEYEKAQLIEDAKKWCKKNGIHWYTDFDPDLKLDLSYALFFGTTMYMLDGKLFPCENYLDKGNYRIVSTEDVLEISGCQTIDEAIKNGRFIRFLGDRDVYRDFSEHYQNGILKHRIERILARNNKFGFYTVFDRLTRPDSISKAWDVYLTQAVEDWCAENHIPFFYSNDNPEPDHLGSKIKNNG